MIGKWSLTVISMELRKQLEYRTQFLVLLFATVTAHLTVAYSVWGAIFSTSGKEEIEGFTLSSMMVYYLAANLVSEAIRPQTKQISGEILDGSLSKYLLYPVSFLKFKFFSYLGHVTFGTMKIILCSVIFISIFGVPVEINLGNLIATIPSFLIAAIIYFLLALQLQLVGFWAEQVWALQYMLIFVIDVIGGAMLPLATFPEYLQTIFNYLPFTYTISFPIEIMLGRVSTEAWIFGTIISLFWIAILMLTASLIWRRGLRHYTGVGL